MEYNDVELRAFTQIAYMDLEAGFEEKSIPAGTPVALVDLLSPKQKQDLIDMGISEQKLNTWKLSAVHNTNDINGFYACVIETSPGNAAVGFRGSEGMGSLSNVQNDWVGADIGLVNSTCTNQQAEVDRFLAKYQDLLDKYGNLTMTGHSLGGNLAEYATIVSNRYGLDDNITQCTSLDGPGFSDEFIRIHQKEIEDMSDKMTHYRWSFVGTMLNDLPGVDYEYLNVVNSPDGDEYNAVTRHSTKFVEYDPETGMFITGEQDGLSKITSIISEGIDHMPPIVGDVLVTVVGSVWIGAMWTKEQMFDQDGNLTTAGYAIIAGGAVAVAVIGIPTVVTTLLTVVVAAVAVIAVAIVYEVVYDLVVAAINAICNAVERIYKWGREIVDRLREATVNFINSIRDWYNRNFNSGFRYANSHPQITIDTYKLRSYAQRIQNVNRRIISLDSRMDSLYWQVGLLDLWNLMQADLLTGFSWRLLRCSGYLNDTANDFDSAENNLISNL